ncbi:BamA/TamA family outer membrane protein [uncultured Mucilaginibacter sp.]|uniref:BamA/TamA family outer membrane protein n=1 Tax=uncultured Mucilaginibacter sp. TaxID=797541 RepID=UPI0025D71326|nr:BamA/TamA family outer membrane protein [uncultured Mucilaginibacter sp.]
MKKILLAFLFCISAFAVRAQVPVDTTNKTDIDTSGQKDLIDIGRSLFRFTPRKNYKEKKQIYFSFLPISSSVPGGSKALVTSTTAGFYLGPRKTTYISSVTFAPYFNLKGRYGLPIHSSIWLTDNSYNVQGDTRLLVYPQYTWGLGGGQPEGNKLLVNYDYIRFYQSLLKRITPYLYAGVGYNMDYFININTIPISPLTNFTNYHYGTAQGINSFSSAITFNALYDTRENSFNPLPGAFANIIYRNNTKLLGSDNNSRSLYIDLRKYISIGNSGQKNQFAFWAYYWTTLSSGTPYLMLPSIGNDPYQRSGRGIEQNRYRGEALAYFETEYRRDITRNGLLGFVLFANINSASQPNSHRFAYLNPAGGTGLRVKFNKKSNTNICIDYGISNGFSDINLALGEAF